MPMPMRPCWVEIHTRILEENFRFLAALAAPYAELLAVLKADAYGHSLEHCAPAVVRAGAKWLGVNSVEEGVAARRLCPQARIVVLAGAFPGQGEAAVKHRLTAVAWETWQLDELEKAVELEAAAHAGAQPGSVPVHLELDTGMSRQGAGPDTLTQVLARFTPGSPLRLEGVMTHLFAADEADGLHTREQLTRLDAMLGQISATGHFAEWLSVGNSAAVVGGRAASVAELAAKHGMQVMMRPGLALYGVTPEFDPDFEGDEPGTVAASRAGLKPVMCWKTQVVSVRDIPAGALVGYNGTFVATEAMRVALLAVGYADGFDRRLGNRFNLLVRGQRAPLVGRVSMDLAVIDVTEIDGVEPGDEVVILGSQGGETVTAYDHARATGTIPWEVFTRIGARVKRLRCD